MNDDPCKKEREEYFKWLDYYGHPRMGIPPSQKTLDDVIEVFPEIAENAMESIRPDVYEAFEGFKKARKELFECEKKNGLR